jgi:hypothetical protein
MRRILILGGGTGGTLLANRLRRMLPARDAEHIVRVGGEYVRVGDCGDAVDQVEAADDDQQNRREQDQALAVSLPRAARLRRWLASLLPLSW